METKQSFNILVVDDEPPICDILSRIAQKEFPEATFTNTRSAQETIDYLNKQVIRLPQLVLLDIDLHQTKDGLDFLPELWSHFQGKVPIIILSVVDNKAKIQQAYEQGAVAFTQKPENMQGWQQYVSTLKNYWHKSVSLPTTDEPIE